MWRQHSGELLLANDLLVINLQDPAIERPDHSVVSHLSLYDVSYVPGGGSGRVAFLRLADEVEPSLERGTILTDNHELAEFLQRRLLGTGWSGVDLNTEPRLAVFERGSMSTGLHVRVETDGLLLQAAWEGLGAPRWVEGASTNYRNEYQWALLREASEGSITVNGRRASGAPFADDRFRSTLGRSVSSCQVGLCEIHVRRNSLGRRAGAPKRAEQSKERHAS